MFDWAPTSPCAGLVAIFVLGCCGDFPATALCQSRIEMSAGAQSRGVTGGRGGRGAEAPASRSAARPRSVVEHVAGLQGAARRVPVPLARGLGLPLADVGEHGTEPLVVDDRRLVDL